MTTATTSPVSFRIRTDVADKIGSLAQRRGLTSSQLIEKLLIEALLAESLLDIDPDDPNSALDLLLEHVKEFLEPRRAARAFNQAVILDVFQHIKDSPALMKLREAAIVPPAASGLSAEARLQYVHQRIARFVKAYVGMESVKEVAVPRSAEALIKSYTELR
jgi:hypothetical protein